MHVQGGLYLTPTVVGVLSLKESVLRLDMKRKPGKAFDNFTFRVTLQVGCTLGSVPIFEFMGVPNKWMDQSSRDKTKAGALDMNLVWRCYGCAIGITKRLWLPGKPAVQPTP